MNGKLLKNKIFVTAAALFCCALWGISTPIVKMGYAYTDPTHVPSLLLWAGIQFLIAGLLTTLIYSFVKKKPVYPKKKSVVGVVLISMTQTVLQYALLYIGLLHTTSVKGTVLKSTDVFFVVLIASLIFRLEKLTLAKIIACVVGFSGVIIMNLDGLSLSFNLGDGLVVLGIVFYSFSVVLTRLFAQDEDPIVLSGYQMSLGGVVMLLIGLIGGGALDFSGMLPIIVILSLLYAVSYSLWTVLLKNNPASSVTINSFMIPVFGVIFSSILLSEQGGVAPLNLIIALVLVCLGIIIWGKCNKE